MSNKIKVNLGTILKSDIREIETCVYTDKDFKIGDVKRYYFKTRNSNTLAHVYGVVLEKQVFNGKLCIKFGIITNYGTNFIIKEISEVCYIEAVRFKDTEIRNLLRLGKLREAKNRLNILTESEFIHSLNSKLENGFSSKIGSSSLESLEIKVDDMYLYISISKFNKNGGYNSILVCSEMASFKPYSDDYSYGIRMRIKPGMYITVNDLDVILKSLRYSLPGDVLD